MEALKNWEITKMMFEVECLNGEELTDTQWENIVDEINGRTANYLDELLANLAVEINEGEWDD